MNMARASSSTSSTISFNPTTSKYYVHFGGTTVETTVSDRAATASQWVQDVASLYAARGAVVGLDVEWRPNFIRGVINRSATLQLCVADRCLILQLIYMDEIPDSVKGFLMNPNFTFVGVEVAADVQKLRDDYGLDCCRYRDIREAAKARWPLRFSRPGLQELAWELCGLQMMKPKDVRTSNWAIRVLTKAQVEYACIDAFASYKVGHKLFIELKREDFGKLLYGCEHYRRRCKLRAPCCDEVFTCRHCHNETTSAFSNPEERHELPRYDVWSVVCAVCDTEQLASNLCTNCGIKFGEYFCDICKFYDDDINKEQFHCSDCGICRVGGRENFFHCPTCGSCYSMSLRDDHQCVRESMKSYCPLCDVFLFDSTKQSRILECGHAMHMECYDAMFSQNQYRCPICFKSAMNMSRNWEILDAVVEATAMPEEYRHQVAIFCNDCDDGSRTFFHIFGHKCQNCYSYNTVLI